MEALNSQSRMLGLSDGCWESFGVEILGRLRRPKVEPELEWHIALAGDDCEKRGEEVCAVLSDFVLGGDESVEHVPLSNLAAMALTVCGLFAASDAHRRRDVRGCLLGIRETHEGESGRGISSGGLPKESVSG